MNTILRAYDSKNNKYDLDLFQDQDFLLDISAKEAGEVPSVFGITSQQIALPATRINNEYFGNLWHLGSLDDPSFIQTYPCQVLENGDEVFTGKIYLQSVVTDQHGDTIYNVLVINETVDFKTQIENLTWKEVFSYFNSVGSGTKLNAGWNHDYTFANISSSWDLGLPETPVITQPGVYLPREGDIVYPLVEYGAKENSSDALIENGGTVGTFTNYATPVTVDQFKPMMRVNAMFKALMRYTGFQYESTFLDSSYFDTVYYLTTTSEEKGAVTNLSATASFSTTKDGDPDQDIPAIFNPSDVKIILTNEIYDNSNSYNAPNSEFTAPITGDYAFQTSLLFAVQNLNTAFQKYAIISLYKNGSPITGLQTVTYDLSKSPAGTMTANWPQVPLTVGDVVTLRVKFIGDTIIPEELRIYGTNATYFQCYSGPSAGIGSRVDMSLNFGDETVKDWLLGMIQKFNLVIEPVKDRKNILRIEPFNDWRDLGDTVDWTDKVDRNVKFEIRHPLEGSPQTVYFSDEEDSDEFNRYSIENLGKTYGDYRYVVDTDVTEGEERVGTYFAPTPMKYIPRSTDIIVPQIYSVNNGAKRPLKFKPRLLHYVGLTNGTSFRGRNGILRTSGQWYFKDETGTVNIMTKYPVAHHNNQVPADDVWDSDTNPSTTLDLHFGNRNHWSYHQDFVNAQTYRDAFYEYWAQYLNEIYDIDSRLVTLNVKLNPVEISQIQLNDKIFIDNTYYRINKIQGASLTNEQSTVVELLKAGTRRTPYTRRRVVIALGQGGTGGSTGGGGGVVIGDDYTEDIIVGSEQSNGKVEYTNYNTGDPVTEFYLIQQAADKDGVVASPSGTFWETAETATPTTNINLGNNYIDKRNAYSTVLGSGNDLLSEGGINVVVGQENSLYTSNGSNLLIAESASVENVENAAIAYPTRPISDSGYNNAVTAGNLVVMSGFAPEYNTVTQYAGAQLNITASAEQYPYYFFNWDTVSGSAGDSYTYLPDAGTLDGVEFRFQLSSSFNLGGTVTLTPSGSQKIDGVSTKVLQNTKDYYLIKSIDGNWKTLYPNTVYYGGFYSSTTQALVTASVSQSVTWDGAYESSGFSIVSGSEIHIDTPGTYQMTAFFQLANNSNDAQDVEFWVKYNGTDYPNSGNYTTIRPRKNVGDPSAQLVTVSFIGTSQTSNDYVEIYWAGTSTDLSLAARVSGSIDGGPASPCAVVNFIPIK